LASLAYRPMTPPIRDPQSGYSRLFAVPSFYL